MDGAMSSPPQQQLQPSMPSPPQQQASQPQMQQQSNQPSMPSPSQQQASQPQMQQQSNQPPSASADISTEEYVEAVIEERWADVEDDIRKIVEWKNRSDQRITQLSQQFDDLKDRFDKLHGALIGKIESYDKNILEVGAEIKAMEKVFSKILPTFTDNVKQLDSITKKLSK
jgi:chromosome segregation ATPase